MVLFRNRFGLKSNELKQMVRELYEIAEETFSHLNEKTIPGLKNRLTSQMQCNGSEISW